MVNAYDIETFREGGTGRVIPFCVCFIIENRDYVVYRCGSDEDVIFESIKIIATKITIDDISLFVHNINFDGVLILEMAAKYKLSFSYFSRDLSIYSININYLGKKITFKCSYKILPMKLESIGEKIGKPKLFFPHKFVTEKRLNYVGVLPSISFFEKISEEDYKALLLMYEIFDLKKISIEYCMRDVEIVILAMSQIYKIILSIDKASIRAMSSPAMAYNIFFRKFNKDGKVKKAISLETNDYLREGYYGGRTEVFGNPTIDEITHYFDFSSMYANCMKEKFPVGRGKFSESKDFNKSGWYDIKYTSNNYIPVLPLHYDGKLLFPNGTLRGLHWFEEIQLFLNNGGVVNEIVSSFVYDSYDYIANDYVDYFIDMRKKDGIFSIFAKLMNNSLYGNFGMKVENSFTYVTFSSEEFEYIIKNFDVKRYFMENDIFIIEILSNYKTKNCFNLYQNDSKPRNIAIAAATTSKARIKLYNAFNEVLKTGGRLCYTDTDSIAAAFKTNMIGQKIGDGEWKEILINPSFIKPKFYIYEKDNEKIVMAKGVNGGKSFDHLKNKLIMMENSFDFDDNLVFRRKDLALLQSYEKRKVNLLDYDKRIFNADRTSTSPRWIHT